MPYLCCPAGSVACNPKALDTVRIILFIHFKIAQEPTKGDVRGTPRPREPQHPRRIRTLEFVSSPDPYDRPGFVPPPRRRVGWLILLVAVLIAGVVLVVIGTRHEGGLGGLAGPPDFVVPELDVAPGTAVPTAVAV